MKSMPFSNRVIFAATLGAVIILIAALLAVSWAHRRAHKPPPDVGALADVLRQSAEKAFAPPTLANEHLVITVAPGKAEPRAKEIIDAAIQAGGTAVKTTNADGSVLLLAQIPSLNAELFRGLVNKTQVVKETATRDGGTRIFEITIKTQPEQK